jgi:hypothetical protein
VSRTTGPNFDVEERSDGIAIVRVWRRPDLSRDEGARCAELIVGHMHRLAGSARCCLFDLSEATASWGPATNRAVGAMLGAWEAAGKPIYVVPATEAIQRLLLRDLQRLHAPRYSRIVSSLESAIELLADKGSRR